MVKIAAVSDLHGYLPEIPECDILLIAGDINGASNVYSQMKFMCGPFKQWLSEIPAKKKIIVAGNHDIIFERNPELLPQWDGNTFYLQDDGIQLYGLNIWGTPWQIRFCDWAFNLDEVDLVKKWDKIPENTDILVTHSPPLGYGDSTMYEQNLGSPSLLDRIQVIKPKLHVYGHIHYGYGQYNLSNNIILANVALCGENYKPTNKIKEFYL